MLTAHFADQDIGSYVRTARKAVIWLSLFSMSNPQVLADGNLWVDLVGPFHDTAGAAALLGVSTGAVRGRQSRGNLLAMRTGSGTWVYPVWQFQDGRVNPGLAKMLRVLSAGNVSGWTMAAWLRSPEVELDGRTPWEVLLAGDEDDLVLLVASPAASGWA